VLAKMAATVDEVSGGRLVLGVGAGWNATEFAAFGLPLDKPVSRFAEAFAIVRGLLAGERVTRPPVEDAVLLPPPARPVPLMVGSNGPRMLSITLPHVDAWNTWWDDYGNTPEGFAALNARISTACDRAGRDPSTLRRSACVLVQVDGGAGERPRGRAVPAEELAAHLRGMAMAGADETILISDPITEASVRALGALVV
jgi:alkanesulfonate monooxygenase SsuD/methylene tetrahydromethanopterin reductase-like flavin-dependent oxidoreductase (luciferase family)